MNVWVTDLPKKRLTARERRTHCSRCHFHSVGRPTPCDHTFNSMHPRRSRVHPVLAGTKTSVTARAPHKQLSVWVTYVHAHSRITTRAHLHQYKYIATTFKTFVLPLTRQVFFRLGPIGGKAQISTFLGGTGGSPSTPIAIILTARQPPPRPVRHLNQAPSPPFFVSLKRTS